VPGQKFDRDRKNDRGSKRIKKQLYPGEQLSRSPSATPVSFSGDLSADEHEGLGFGTLAPSRIGMAAFSATETGAQTMSLKVSETRAHIEIHQTVDGAYQMLHHQTGGTAKSS
jgi:hypothetical protein